MLVHDLLKIQTQPGKLVLHADHADCAAPARKLGGSADTYLWCPIQGDWGICTHEPGKNRAASPDDAAILLRLTTALLGGRPLYTIVTL